MQNSKAFASQRLQAPLLEKSKLCPDVDQRNELQRLINQRFLQQVEKIFAEFADYKIRDDEQSQSDVYCKLLTKRHLLLIEVPTAEMCQ